MQYNPNHLKIDVIDKGYAVLFVDRSGNAVTDANYKEYVDTIALNQALSGDSKSRLTNYYFITTYYAHNQPLIDEIEGNKFSCRCYCVPVAQLDEFISRYFPDYDGETRNVWLVETINNNETERIKDSMDFRKDVYTSILRNYGAMTMLNVLDAYRALAISGKDITFISHIEHELEVANRKLDFLNGFKRFKSEDF